MDIPRTQMTPTQHTPLNSLQTQLYDTTDTICAISTPPGRGGIAIIRLAGPDALPIAQKIWKGRPLADLPSHTAHLGQIVDPADPSTPLDTPLITIFRAPRSFTGQDTIEFAVHGSTYIQTSLIRLLTSVGARLALPGEFTRRAYTSGRLDITQAEAIADIIAADSRAAHRIATTQMQGSLATRLDQIRGQLLHIASLLELELDFSEEHVEFVPRPTLRDLAATTIDQIDHLAATFTTGQAIRDGIPTAIIGAPNAGKSSLLNLLLDYERAIVTPIPGTTRDLIEDTLLIGDYRLRLIDTAGLRHTTDPIETIGINLTNQAITRAALILHVHDITTPLPSPSDPHSPLRNIPAGTPVITILNKTDLTPHPTLRHLINTANTTNSDADTTDTIAISAQNREGIDRLRQTILDTIHTHIDPTPDDIILTSERHTQALQATSAALRQVIEGLDTTLPTDLIALDLRTAIAHLTTITAPITTPDLLNNIFSHFCVGK